MMIRGSLDEFFYSALKICKFNIFWETREGLKLILEFINVVLYILSKEQRVMN